MSVEWVQIGTDVNGENPGDYAGTSVSLSRDGSTIAIGAIKNDGNGSDSGHVQIYRNESGSWLQIGEDIDGENESDFSGYSTSISSDGSIVAIGAYGNSDNGLTSGHVRIYQNVDEAWSQIGEDIECLL